MKETHGREEGHTSSETDRTVNLTACVCHSVSRKGEVAADPPSFDEGGTVLSPWTQEGTRETGVSRCPTSPEEGLGILTGLYRPSYDMTSPGRGSLFPTDSERDVCDCKWDCYVGVPTVCPLLPCLWVGVGGDPVPCFLGRFYRCEPPSTLFCVCMHVHTYTHAPSGCKEP